MSAKATLAAKNHNPLNIRPLANDTWQGQIGVNTNPASGSFCVFEDNTWGVRAAVKNLQSYVRNGIRTLEQAIYRWAPPNDPHIPNHTEAYIKRVCGDAGVPRNYDLTWIANPSPATQETGNLMQIIRAMNVVEAGGATITDAETMAGIERAFGWPVSDADIPPQPTKPLAAKPRTLRAGDTGDDVKALKRALNSQNGAMLDADDPAFDGLCFLAVKYFQTARGLKPDGIVGPITSKALWPFGPPS